MTAVQPGIREVLEMVADYAEAAQRHYAAVDAGGERPYRFETAMLNLEDPIRGLDANHLRTLACAEKFWLGDEEGLSVAGLIATLQALPYGRHGQEATVFVGGEPVTGMTTSFHRVRDIFDFQVYLHTESNPPSEMDLPLYAVITPRGEV